MTESELINEVRFIFEEETSMGFTDTNTIKGALRDGLDNIAGVTNVIEEELIEIENGKGKLPSNFKKILSAKEIKVEAYECSKEECPCDKKKVYKNLLKICNTCNDEVFRSKYRVYTKKYGWGKNNIYYKPVRELEVENILSNRNPSLDHMRYFSDRNGKVVATKYDIFTDMPDGFIYLKYNAYPTNKEGEIYIPKTPRNDLKNYILNKAIAATARVIMIKERDPFMSEIYQMYKAEEDLYQERADYESKMMFLKQNKTKEQVRLKNSLENKKLRL